MTETLVIHQGYDSPVQARATVPDDPGYSSSTPRDWFVLDMMGSEVEQPVNVNTAMTFSAVFGCVRYISQTLASLGWHVYDRQGERSKVVIEDDTAWLLGMQASEEMNAFEWRQVELKDALTWGNGYSEIERDGYGRPYAMYRIDPWRVCPDRDSRGRLIYEVQNGSGVHNTILDPSSVFHLKAIGSDGLVGYSIIEIAKRAIELGMQQGTFGQSFFRRGPMPGGILKMTGHVKEEERKAARKSFEDSYGGSKKAGKVVVVSGGMDFVPLPMPNQDAQWLESRSFEVEEICRFYGVPPHKIAKLDRSTNNNIEHQSIEAVQDCLLPWARRLECEADVKLFGRKMRGRRFTRLNLKSLLRGDSKTQTENIRTLVTGGVMTPNEGREYIDLNPMDNGDVLLVQGAMITLERAVEGDPEPAPAPTPEPTPTDPPADDTMPQDLRETFLSLLEGTYARLLRVEADKAKRAANKGSLAEWIGQYYDDAGKERVAKAVRPLLSAFLLAAQMPTDSVERLASLCAAQHIDDSVKALKQVGVDVVSMWFSDDPLASTRANQQAGEHLDAIWKELQL